MSKPSLGIISIGTLELIGTRKPPHVIISNGTLELNGMSFVLPTDHQT